VLQPNLRAKRQNVPKVNCEVEFGKALFMAFLLQ
jgi:hypothetical protein